MMKSGLFQDDLEHFGARRCSHRWKSSESDFIIPSLLPAHLSLPYFHQKASDFASFMPSWFVLPCLIQEGRVIFWVIFQHAYLCLIHKERVIFFKLLITMPIRALSHPQVSCQHALSCLTSPGRWEWFSFKASDHYAFPGLISSRKREWFFCNFLVIMPLLFLPCPESESDFQNFSFFPPCLSLPYLIQIEFANLLEEAIFINFIDSRMILTIRAVGWS